MPAYKDKVKGTWYASFYYEDWTGKKSKEAEARLHHQSVTHWSGNGRFPAADRPADLEYDLRRLRPAICRRI